MTNRIMPTRMALEIAHRKLRTTKSLDEMLKSPALARTLEAVARRHMKRMAQRDIKKLQANDDD